MAKVAFHPVVGNSIAWLFKDRLPSWGATVITSSPSVKPSYKAQIFWRRYEHTEIGFIRRYLRKDFDIVELGSSIGVVTAHLAPLLASGRQMVCVEANVDLIDSVWANARANSRGGRVAVRNLAIAYDRDTVSFKSADSLWGGVVEGDDANSVKAATLSQIVGEFNIDDYVLVCDIEGSEAEIWEKDADTLRRCKQIVVELHGTPSATVSSMRQSIMDLGFNVRDSRHNVYFFER